MNIKFCTLTTDTVAAKSSAALKFRALVASLASFALVALVLAPVGLARADAQDSSPEPSSAAQSASTPQPDSSPEAAPNPWARFSPTEAPDGFNWPAGRDFPKLNPDGTWEFPSSDSSPEPESDALPSSSPEIAELAELSPESEGIRPGAAFAACQGTETLATYYNNGTEISPYIICTPAQLADLATRVNDPATNADFDGKRFTLEADLDLSGYANWTPIGRWCEKDSQFDPAICSAASFDYAFRGSFNGQGHTISNLTQNSVGNVATSESFGLFGSVEFGIIRNLLLENVNVNSVGLAGGVAGFAQSSIIASVAVQGNVAGGIAGLIAGSASSSSIAASYAQGSVSANLASSLQYCELGGIAGVLSSDSIMDVSSFFGTVTSARQGDIGGLAGAVVFGSRIEDSVASAVLASTSSSSSDEVGIGGLAGVLYKGRVKNSVSLSPSISAPLAISHVGRIFGLLAGEGDDEFENNYSYQQTLINGYPFSNSPLQESYDAAETKDGASVYCSLLDGRFWTGYHPEDGNQVPDVLGWNFIPVDETFVSALVDSAKCQAPAFVSALSNYELDGTNASPGVVSGFGFAAAGDKVLTITGSGFSADTFISAWSAQFDGSNQAYFATPNAPASPGSPSPLPLDCQILSDTKIVCVLSAPFFEITLGNVSFDSVFSPFVSAHTEWTGSEYKTVVNTSPIDSRVIIWKQGLWATNVIPLASSLSWETKESPKLFYGCNNYGELFCEETPSSVFAVNSPIGLEIYGKANYWDEGDGEYFINTWSSENSNYTWTSSDTSVLTVDQNGIVNPVTTGLATVRATLNKPTPVAGSGAPELNFDGKGDYLEVQIWAGAELPSECFFNFGHFSGGDGSSLTPFQIASARELKLLSCLVNSEAQDENDAFFASLSYVLTADIDLSFGATADAPFGLYQPTANGAQGWEPIGNYGANDSEDNFFQGTFNGQGHTVSNLKIAATAGDNFGLFGYAQDAQISNLVADNFDINVYTSDSIFAGAIAADLEQYEGPSTLSNVVVLNSKINVVENGDFESYLGRVLGGDGYSTITNAYALYTNEINGALIDSSVASSIEGASVTCEALNSADFWTKPILYNETNNPRPGLGFASKPAGIAASCPPEAALRLDSIETPWTNFVGRSLFPITSGDESDTVVLHGNGFLPSLISDGAIPLTAPGSAATVVLKDCNVLTLKTIACETLNVSGPATANLTARLESSSTSWDSISAPNLVHVIANTSGFPASPELNLTIPDATANAIGISLAGDLPEYVSTKFSRSSSKDPSNWVYAGSRPGTSAVVPSGTVLTTAPAYLDNTPVNFGVEFCNAVGCSRSFANAMVVSIDYDFHGGTLGSGTSPASLIAFAENTITIDPDDAYAKLVRPNHTLPTSPSDPYGWCLDGSDDCGDEVAAPNSNITAPFENTVLGANWVPTAIPFRVETSMFYASALDAWGENWTPTQPEPDFFSVVKDLADLGLPYTNSTQQPLLLVADTSEPGNPPELDPRFDENPFDSFSLELLNGATTINSGSPIVSCEGGQKVGPFAYACFIYLEDANLFTSTSPVLKFTPAATTHHTSTTIVVEGADAPPVFTPPSAPSPGLITGFETHYLDDGGHFVLDPGVQAADEATLLIDGSNFNQNTWIGFGSTGAPYPWIASRNAPWAGKYGWDLWTGSSPGLFHDTSLPCSLVSSEQISCDLLESIMRHPDYWSSLLGKLFPYAIFVGDSSGIFNIYEFSNYDPAVVQASTCVAPVNDLSNFGALGTNQFWAGAVACYGETHDWSESGPFLPALSPSATPVPTCATLGFAGGYGTEDHPCLINTAAQLKTLADITNAGSSWGNDAAKHFALGADIDLGGPNSPVQPCSSGLGSSCVGGWNPIGDNSHPFKATFDGAGHSIRGLWINRESTNGQGLFGETDGAAIKNTYLASGSITIPGTNVSSRYAGAFAGYAKEGSFENLVSGVSVSAGSNASAHRILTVNGLYSTELQNVYALSTAKLKGAELGAVATAAKITPNGADVYCALLSDAFWQGVLGWSKSPSLSAQLKGVDPAKCASPEVVSLQTNFQNAGGYVWPEDMTGVPTGDGVYIVNGSGFSLAAGSTPSQTWAIGLGEDPDGEGLVSLATANAPYAYPEATTGALTCEVLSATQMRCVSPLRLAGIQVGNGRGFFTQHLSKYDNLSLDASSVKSAMADNYDFYIGNKGSVETASFEFPQALAKATCFDRFGWFGGGDGSEEDPYEVDSAQDLALLACLTNESERYSDGELLSSKNYIQTANIDLNAGYDAGTAPHGTYQPGDEGWDPIGTIESPFVGIYNGDGYRISNIYLDRHASGAPGANKGLFGVAQGAEITNIYLDSGQVKGAANVGAVLGLAVGGAYWNIVSGVDVWSTVADSAKRVIGSALNGPYLGNIWALYSAKVNDVKTPSNYLDSLSGADVTCTALRKSDFWTDEDTGAGFPRAVTGMNTTICPDSSALTLTSVESPWPDPADSVTPAFPKNKTNLSATITLHGTGFFPGTIPADDPLLLDGIGGSLQLTGCAVASETEIDCAGFTSGGVVSKATATVGSVNTPHDTGSLANAFSVVENVHAAPSAPPKLAAKITDAAQAKVRLSWSASTDAETAQDLLKYKVVQSATSSCGADTSGTQLMGWTTAALAFNVSSALTPGVAQYFCVYAKDEFDAVSAPSLLAVTLYSVTYTAANSFTTNFSDPASPSVQYVLAGSSLSASDTNNAIPAVPQMTAWEAQEWFIGINTPWNAQTEVSENVAPWLDWTIIPPTAPVISPSSVKDRASFSWASSGATSYNYECGSDPDFTSASPTVINAVSYTLSLASTGEVYCRVQAKDAEETSDWSPTASATVVSVSFSINEATSPSSIASQYTLAGAPTPLPSDPVRSSYTFSGWCLNNDYTPHSYGDGCSSPLKKAADGFSNPIATDSTLIAAWRPEGHPVPGTPISFSAPVDGGLTVSWGEATDPIVSNASDLTYTLYRSTTNCGATIEAWTSACQGRTIALAAAPGQLSFQTTGLANGTEYYWAVVVTDGDSLQALYQPVSTATYQAAFNLNGATGASSPATGYFLKGDQLSLPAIPGAATLPGYTLQQVWTSSPGVSPLATQCPVEAYPASASAALPNTNQTLYACWLDLTPPAPVGTPSFSVPDPASSQAVISFPTTTDAGSATSKTELIYCVSFSPVGDDCNSAAVRTWERAGSEEETMTAAVHPALDTPTVYYIFVRDQAGNTTPTPTSVAVDVRSLTYTREGQATPSQFYKGSSLVTLASGDLIAAPAGSAFVAWCSDGTLCSGGKSFAANASINLQNSTELTANFKYTLPAASVNFAAETLQGITAEDFTVAGSLRPSLAIDPDWFGATVAIDRPQLGAQGTPNYIAASDTQNLVIPGRPNALTGAEFLSAPPILTDLLTGEISWANELTPSIEYSIVGEGVWFSASSGTEIEGDVTVLRGLGSGEKVNFRLKATATSFASPAFEVTVPEAVLPEDLEEIVEEVLEIIDNLPAMIDSPTGIVEAADEVKKYDLLPDADKQALPQAIREDIEEIREAIAEKLHTGAVADEPGATVSAEGLAWDVAIKAIADIDLPASGTYAEYEEFKAAMAEEFGAQWEVEYLYNVYPEILGTNVPLHDAGANVSVTLTNPKFAELAAAFAAGKVKLFHEMTSTEPIDTVAFTFDPATSSITFVSRFFSLYSLALDTTPPPPVIEDCTNPAWANLHADVCGNCSNPEYLATHSALCGNCSIPEFSATHTDQCGNCSSPAFVALHPACVPLPAPAPAPEAGGGSPAQTGTVAVWMLTLLLLIGTGAVTLGMRIPLQRREME